MFSTEPSLECISLTEGLEVDVIVTGVKGPYDFCIQPYGDQLVELMERMGCVVQLYVIIILCGGTSEVAYMFTCRETL